MHTRILIKKKISNCIVIFVNELHCSCNYEYNEKYCRNHIKYGDHTALQQKIQCKYAIQMQLIVTKMETWRIAEKLLAKSQVELKKKQL